MMRNGKYITDRWKKYGHLYLSVPFREELKEACDNEDFIELLYTKKRCYYGDGISYGSWGSENIALINVAKAFGFNPNVTTKQ